MSRAPRLRTTIDGQEKFCGKCEEWWPADLDFFFADPNGSAGLYFCCKACYGENFRGRPSRNPRPIEEAPSLTLGLFLAVMALEHREIA